MKSAISRKLATAYNFPSFLFGARKVVGHRSGRKRKRLPGCIGGGGREG